jgi:hypothetical protein
MIDIRQSVQYVNYLEREGWIVERIEDVNYFIRKLPLIGSVLKLQRPEKIDFTLMIRIIKEYRVFQIIIEPKDDLQAKLVLKHGFKLSNSPYLPSKTLQIDLTQSQKTIFSHFRKDARQALRKVNDPERAKRVEWGRSITTHQCSTLNDIREWREAWRKSVKLDRYVPATNQLLNLRKSFPDNNSLILASHNITGSIIGGALFMISSHGISNYISYYWYGFTNKEGRSSLSQYSLIWEGLLWAKKQGCKVFDFEGIYDPRSPNKSWLGFTHFKKSFGGREVLYPGCYTQFRFPIRL